MSKVSIIGIDLAKQVFQLHGASPDRSALFRKRLSRSRVLGFLEQQQRCTIALEACATAHDWGRRIGALGHEVMLIPPVNVKPFVKRQKNDAANAQAITKAALRPGMARVAVKTRDQQARAMLFRSRDLLVRQRTQLINALRGHPLTDSAFPQEMSREVGGIWFGCATGTCPPLTPCGSSWDAGKRPA